MKPYQPPSIVGLLYVLVIASWLASAVLILFGIKDATTANLGLAMGLLVNAILVHGFASLVDKVALAAHHLGEINVRTRTPTR